MPSIRPLNPNISVFADPKFGQSSAPRIMDRIDRSMGIPAPASIESQARAAIMRLAQMEQQRQILTTKGYAEAANRTLQGMGAVFAEGPTTFEMQGVLKNAMTNGGIVSGKDYYDKIQRGVSPSYSHTSNAPENLKAYAQRAADAAAGAVPAALRPYIRPSIQAASYVYATRQAQQTGAALAGIPDSIVDRARLAHMAEERATYLMGLAGLGRVAMHGLGWAPSGGPQVNLARIQQIPCTTCEDRFNCTFTNSDIDGYWGDNRKVRAWGVFQMLNAILGGRAPTSEEIEYFGAMQWCAHDPNKSGNMIGAMRAALAKRPENLALSRDDFPGGPAAFDKAFKERSWGADVSWLNTLQNIVGDVTGGGNAPPPCPRGPNGEYQYRKNPNDSNSPCISGEGGESDWTTIALYGLAAVAAFYVVKNIQR